MQKGYYGQIFLPDTDYDSKFYTCKSPFSPPPIIILFTFLFIYIFCGEYLSYPFYDMAASTSGQEEANPVF